MRQTSIKGQADYIVSHIRSIGNYESEIWFTEGLSHIPGSNTPSIFSQIPHTPLLQKAVNDRKISVIGKAGSTKQYTGSEPPYMVAYPLIVQDLLLGAIQVIRLDSMPFSREEVEFFDGLTANVAVALQISHQTIIKNWRLEQLSLVRTVSQQIANVLDLDELCQKVTSLIRNTFHYYAVTIFTVVPGKEQMTFRAWAGPFENTSSNLPPLSARFGRGIVGAAASRGQELLANDVSREPLYLYTDQLPLTKSEVALPLKLEDRVLGILDIQSEHLFAFHEMDMRVLRSLADNIASAVEGTNLYTAVEKRAEQLSIVSEVGKALSSILDFDLLLKQIVNLIHEKFKYPFIHLFLVQKENDQLVFRAGAGDRAEIIEQVGLQYGINDPEGIIPWVARNGISLIANDVTQEPHYRPSSFYPGETASEMAIPLMFGHEALGVLDIQSDQSDNFDELDLQLFETLADSIGIAIRNSILFNSERWRRQAADSLREVAGLLSSNIALDKLMDIILTELEQILPCDASAIWLIQEGERLNNDLFPLKLAAVHGTPMDPITKSCCEEPSILEWLNNALQNTRPTVRSPQDPYEPLGKALLFGPEYSSIAAPMLIDDKPVGIITLAHNTAGRYGLESIQMTSAFASYAAVAIQNTRLYASAQEQAWIATVLLQVAEATQSITTVDELLKAVTRLTPMLVGVSGCALLLWEENLEAFTIAGTHEIQFQDELAEKSWIKPAQANGLQRLLTEKTAAIIDNLDMDLPILAAKDGMDENLQYALLPLLSRGTILGAFLISYHGVRNNSPVSIMEDERLAIIQGIAHQTAIAVENIRLLENQQQETYISTVLLQVAQTMVSQNDLNDIFASVVQITQILAGSQVCAIYLWNETAGGYQAIKISGVSTQKVEELQSSIIEPDHASLLEYITDHDVVLMHSISPTCATEPATWLDLDPEEQLRPEEIQTIHMPILIGVPLSIKGELFGVMLVVDPGDEKIYFHKRLEIITGIGRQTSLAIQNDRLLKAQVTQEKLEREFQLAREIQETFLPTDFPHPEGWQLETRWRPARDVGGDFFDIFSLPNNRLALVIADVSDKGISAALYMTLTRTLIRTVAQQANTPSEILAQVNDLLLRDTPHGMFITAVLGILDTRTGELTYANAGHNLPLIRRKDDQNLVSFEKGSMPLGILEKLSFKDKNVTLMPGDTLLMFTDGITEAFVETEYFGDERLAEAILRSEMPDASTIMEDIDSALMEFSGTSQPSDDVTALAISRK